MMFMIVLFRKYSPQFHLAPSLWGVQCLPQFNNTLASRRKAENKPLKGSYSHITPSDAECRGNPPGFIATFEMCGDP